MTGPEQPGWLEILFPQERNSPGLAVRPPEGLSVRKALVLLCAYLAATYLVAAIVNDYLPIGNPLAKMALSACLAASASLALLVNMARRVVGKPLSLSESTEAAWVVGSPSHMALGALAGMALSVIAIAVTTLVPPPEDGAAALLLTRLTTTPGITAVFWWPTLVILAPVAEELLFRGLLLGAMSRFTGRALAITIVTIIFVGAHFRVLIPYWPVVIPLGLLGVTAAVVRFRAQAVGPAVLLHVSYNLSLGAATALLAYLR